MERYQSLTHILTAARDRDREIRFIDGITFALFGSVARSGFALFEAWSALLPAAGVATVAWLLSAGVVIVVFHKLLGVFEDDLDVSFALAVTVGLLVAPRTGWYDWILLLVPGVLLWRVFKARRRLLIRAGAVLYLVAALSWPMARGLDHVTGIYLQIAPFVLMAIGWWLFTRLRQDSLSLPAESPIAAEISAPATRD